MVLSPQVSWLFFNARAKAPMGAVMAVATEDRAPVPVGMPVARVPIPGTAPLARATAADPPPTALVRNTGPSDNGDPDSDPPATTDPTDPTAVNNSVDF